MKRSLRRTGFTLIELMVVVAIIGILASVLYVSFGDARDNARNKALKAELKEVQLALELYKAQNESYPPADGNLAGHLVPDFISALPVNRDSSNSSCSIEYQTGNSDSWYKYTADRCLAGADTAATGMTYRDELARCLQSCDNGSRDHCDPDDAEFYQSFAVFSLGGECEE